MGDVAISVRGLTKQYAIAGVRHDTLRDQLVHLCRSLAGATRR